MIKKPKPNDIDLLNLVNDIEKKINPNLQHFFFRKWSVYNVNGIELGKVHIFVNRTINKLKLQIIQRDEIAQLSNCKIRMFCFFNKPNIGKVKAVAHLETPVNNDYHFPELAVDRPDPGIIRDIYDQELEASLNIGQRWVVTPYYSTKNNITTFQKLCQPMHLHLREPGPCMKNILEDLRSLAEVIIQYNGNAYAVNKLSDRIFADTINDATAKNHLVSA